MSSAILQSCYELPWSPKNNPNAWIEPTTHCQLKCPGCYRGVDKPNHDPVHLKIEEVRGQIDYFIENRNIQTVSVAGGDPLLYPHLYKLVEYCSKRKLRTMIYTNGIALNEERLRRLKDCGATQIVIHVDRFQGRTSNETPEELNQIRQGYCDMFRKVRGVNLGFIQPVTKSCLDDLNKLTDFFEANRDIISLIVYTLYREICWDHAQKPGIDTSIQVADALAKLKKLKVFYPAAILPGTINKQEPSWTFSYSLGYKNKTLGFLNGAIYRMIQEKYYKRRKKFLFISKSYLVRRISLLRIIFYRSIFRVFMKDIFLPQRWKEQLFFQTTLLLRGPIKQGKSWDLCKGCPDVMLYNGKQVPSCILEDLKLSKNISITDK